MVRPSPTARVFGKNMCCTPATFMKALVYIGGSLCPLFEPPRSSIQELSKTFIRPTTTVRCNMHCHQLHATTTTQIWINFISVINRTLISKFYSYNTKRRVMFNEHVMPVSVIVEGAPLQVVHEYIYLRQKI